jgi:transcriptional regulator with XRE-family HTH domain
VAKKLYNAEETILWIAHRIKQLRIEAGYSSYEEFALEHNIDRKQYWRVENGSNLTLKSLIRIINCHKLSLAQFFEGM